MQVHPPAGVQFLQCGSASFVLDTAGRAPGRICSRCKGQSGGFPSLSRTIGASPAGWQVAHSRASRPSWAHHSVRPLHRVPVPGRDHRCAGQVSGVHSCPSKQTAAWIRQKPDKQGFDHETVTSRSVYFNAPAARASLGQRAAKRKCRSIQKRKHDLFTALYLARFHPVVRCSKCCWTVRRHVQTEL